jgi:uncharacterized protein YkwD
MLVRRALTYTLLAVLFTGWQPARVGAVGSPPSAAASAADLEEILFQAINRERAANHLAPLRRAQELNAVAQSHSRDMMARDYFDHRTPEGLGLRERIQRGNVTGWRRIAENISSSRSCARFDAVRMAVEGWMNSPGHRQNVLDKQMQETGIGIAMDAEGKTYYITQVYVARR